MSRRTDQREAIRTTFQESERPLSAQEVLESANLTAPGLGIATVYRHIKSFLADGWLKAVELPGEAARYELADQAHHHHFSCSDCGRVFDIEGCAGGVDRLAPDGFVVTSHEIVLYGQCAECASESAATTT